MSTCALSQCDDIRIAIDSFGNEFAYTVCERGYAAIVGGKVKCEHLAVPASFDGHPVAHIGEGAFTDQHFLKSVRFPASLRTIENHAFARCMYLENVELNNGLESIGYEAFATLNSRTRFTVPASVKHVGAHFAGRTTRTSGFSSSYLTSAREDHQAARLQDFISPNHPHLIVDDQGILYERNACGLSLVDGSAFAGIVCTPLPETTEIGPHAMECLATLMRVVLPEGLCHIRESAFRGCTNLREIVFPESLRSIADAAFACTALKAVYLPKHCTDLAPFALNTGPVVQGRETCAFTSALESITVHPENPVYCTRGCLLCKQHDDGCRLEAIACTHQAADIHLGKNVTRVGQSAFAGTSHIGTFRFHEGLRFDNPNGLLPHYACDHLVVELEKPVDGCSEVSLEMPKGKLGKDVLAAALVNNSVDVEQLLQRYDEAIPNTSDKLQQARQMIARLAVPLLLTEGAKKAFRSVIEAGFDSICAHFGARSYWQGFDQMADAGILNERTIPHAISVLTTVGDSLSAAYLLDMKRTRFSQMSWDYGI